jgi:hypothetical protein
LSAPASVVAGFVRVLRSGGRLSLIDTDWSTLHLEARDMTHFVGKIHEAARRQRFKMSITMHAVRAVRV